METVTAVVLGGRPQGRVEIASVLAAESVEVWLNTHCASQAIEVARLRRPRIAVLDIATFDISGINLIRQFRGLDRKLGIIVLTQQHPRHFSARYKRAGATVLLNTSSDIRGLAFILRAIRSGFACFDFIHAPIKTREWSFDNETDLIATLTDRELTVFQGLAADLSSQAIAEEMKISSRAVGVYKNNIFEKLFLTSLLQLQELAARNELV